MAEHVQFAQLPEKLQVFISSTIGECASERAAAQRAIRSLNLRPIQFEREGARAEQPRDFYLRKLHDAQIVVGIYRSSYGWIDQAKGMEVSGVEDEYRETCRIGKDLLVYVERDAENRDHRLQAMIDEITSGSNVVYFFDDGEDLEKRIRDDITALVSEKVVIAQRATPQASQAGVVLNTIFRDAPLRIKRSALLDALTGKFATARIVWVVGEAGAGKTALTAEWAVSRDAAYVNARELDPRALILACASAIGVLSSSEFAIPTFEQASKVLASRWSDGHRWPLIIDDPNELKTVWPLLAECLALNGQGSIIIAARHKPSDLPGETLKVSGFTDQEIYALEAISGKDRVFEAGKLPISLREQTQEASVEKRFDALDPLVREAVGYIALSPVSLNLEDLLALLGSNISETLQLSDALNIVADLLVETSIGYSFVHENIRDRINSVLKDRAQLSALLTKRLSKRLAQTGRAWAAFQLRRDENSGEAIRLANAVVNESVFSGSAQNLFDALDFLANRYRASAELGPLLSVLISQADICGNLGRPEDHKALLNEAQVIAAETGDTEALQSIEIARAALSLRSSGSIGALAKLQELRRIAESEARHVDQARLLIEEGVAFLGANDSDQAIPLFREAKAVFEQLEDNYGVEVATRNLIIALSNTNDGVAEAEQLRTDLTSEGEDHPRYRAWLCNLLVPRLRRQRKFEEAEKMALEAIEIGESLGDLYLVSINQIVLGNVLREAGKFSGAVAAYSKGGQIGQSISRPDIEGRSSRLLALTENEQAQSSDGDSQRQHAERAEQYALHAVSLFADSFAWSEKAYAFEELGDARRHQNRNSGSFEAYADAVACYLRAEEDEEACRLLHHISFHLNENSQPAYLLLRAFGCDYQPDNTGESGAWVRATVASMEQCPRAVAPGILGALVRNFYPAANGHWWFSCLQRSLLMVQRDVSKRERRGMGLVLLLAILGFGRSRELSRQDLIALAGICVGQFDDIAMRHRPDGDLDCIIYAGKKQEVLFTVRTEAQCAEALFVTLIIAAFLGAFGDGLTEILFSEGPPEGLAQDIVVFAQSTEKGPVAEFMCEGLADKPVATARMLPDQDEEVPIVVFTREDAIVQLAANYEQGGELEVMLARVVEEIIFAALGSSIDNDIYSSKIRDLLMSVVR
ncbi:DUF4062 domain-containing protein [Roseobacteraceae bacterium S113]